MNNISDNWKVFFLVLLLFMILPVVAQNDTIKKNDGKDTSTKIIEKTKEVLNLDSQKSKEIFNENRIQRRQKNIFDDIDKEIQHADFALKTGVDYKSFTSELTYVVALKKKAVDGITNNRSDFKTVRNITVTSIMLKELQTRIDLQINNIKKDSDALTQIQNKIDSLIIDESLFVVPKDSSTKIIYFSKFNEMSAQMTLLNSRFKNALDSINGLEIIGNDFKFELQNDIIEIDKVRKEEFANMFKSTGGIFKHHLEEKSFGESFKYSFLKEFVILAFFISNHSKGISFMVLFVICIAVYLFFLRNKYKSSGIYDEIKLSKKIFKHPIATAILISFTLFNFFFLFPPFAYTALIWTISIVALKILNKEESNKQEMLIWDGYSILILLSLFDNNILVHTVTEVYFIIFLATVSVLFSCYVLFKSAFIINDLYRYTLYVVIGSEILSIIIILIGNYNLGKLLMVNGLITVLMYYLFTNTYKLIVAILKYSKYLKETDDEKKIDRKTLEDAPYSASILFLFILGWLISGGKNSYFFQTTVDPIIEFFTEKRTLGDITYTYSSIGIFFLVLVISVFLAKIVSFLSSNTETTNSGAKVNKFGSWLLLIQIAIYTIGITIAFASAGIPIDRLTIIISALGVGIGFGLQTLVNNLVSGLIIAFEKPVNLDDVIEVGGQTGKMKSIGIRSSVITTYDGADVVIPNGDLLSQHLTNWTLGNDKKRVEITVGVAYGTDLEHVKRLLFDILKKHDLVLQYPAPIVWVTNFNNSSIDFDVKFWVAHISYANDVRSDIFIAIDIVFKANEIEIPFPKQDIYIKENKLEYEKKEHSKE